MSAPTAALTPQITIADLMKAWPQTIPFLLAHQMSCVGCSMAAFDTLEEVATTYGLDLDQLIANLTSVISAGPDGS